MAIKKGANWIGCGIGKGIGLDPWLISPEWRRISAIWIWMFLLSLFFPLSRGLAENRTLDSVQELVAAFKEDPRGPYQAIKWFCPDGSVLPAKERCEKPGGMQHALPKDAVRELAEKEGIYLGAILAGTPLESFWDAENRNARLKQYILERYLQAADDGWIMRKARYYRGAVQAEDEEKWGREFLTWLLNQEEPIASQFYLTRQAVREIPHRGNKEDLWTRIRAASGEISDLHPGFMDLRVKIHGRPETGDIEKIRKFMENRRQELSPDILKKMQGLVKDLETAFAEARLETLSASIDRLPSTLPIQEELKDLVKTHAGATSPGDSDPWISRCDAEADHLVAIREALPGVGSAKARLTLLDISVDLEKIFFRDALAWKPGTYRTLLRKAYMMAKAAVGCGFLELWEWEETGPLLKTASDQERITLDRFVEQADYARRLVEWSVGMCRAAYGPTIETFSAFEPLARGFLDDRIRSSILLPMGDVAGRLSDVTAKAGGISNQVMGIADPNRIRGLNPGFARGELVVVRGTATDIRFEGDKIYALSQVPADMKPVAGVVSASEGNLVSHIQLLARNLGIPNAVITPAHLAELERFAGRIVFYAVSPGGRVILKPASEMTPRETALVEKRERADERVTVPTDKLRLDQTDLVGLEALRSSDSGRVCGPKAANLGQLKNLFPDHVADGLVIPFGVYRAHMAQTMPGYGIRYWDFLEATFALAQADREAGKPLDHVEAATLSRLSELRQAIQRIPFLPGFEARLADRFAETLGKRLGDLPVFIRSDTNMEDLPDFTGAGLNLTVFNVRDTEKIRQGIRDVWASPFTERGYLWRQKFMRNPENVFPSILILPTVTVDSSGVLITAGLSGGGPDDLTVAFSRGPGGAVEGQAAESYLVRPDGGHRLLSPSREPKFNVLPATGGLDKGYAHFNRRILTPKELLRLRDFADRIKQLLPGAPGIESAGPFDVELGFKGEKIWLFQVRPYVENKRAKGSLYLRDLDEAKKAATD